MKLLPTPIGFVDFILFCGLGGGIFYAKPFEFSRGQRAAFTEQKKIIWPALAVFDGKPVKELKACRLGSFIGGGGFFRRLRSRPWVLGRYVPRMDADAVREAGESAARLSGPDGAVRCVFLLSGRLGRATDLAEAIADVQRRARARAGRGVLLVPVDVRSWKAYLPRDAPSLARAIVARLQS